MSFANEADPPSKLFPIYKKRENIADPTRINVYIRKLLELFPDSCLGGSSVLHDIVLPPIEQTDKSWATRDFDIYCLDKDYSKIFYFLKTCPTIYFVRSISNIKKMRYANLEIKNLSEFSLLIMGFHRKLQLVNIGNYSDYSNLYNSIDLSFCSVVMLNNMVYYLKTTKSDVLAKTGRLLQMPCMCSTCAQKNKILLNRKLIERVKKYRLRGFTITNICQFCDYGMNTFEHIPICLIYTLFKKHVDSLHCILYSHTNTSKLGIEEINRLISYSHQYKDNSIVLLSIYSIFAYFKRIDLLHLFWEENKTLVDVLSLMKCSEQLINEGLYTGFRLLFEYFVLHMSEISYEEQNEYIMSLMEIVVKRNFIQCAVLIQSHIITIEINIYEDQIFDWKNRMVYDVLFELLNDESNPNNTSQEIDSLLKTIPFIKKLSVDDPIRETTCPICKYDNCSSIMACGHSFCQNCIILQLMSTYEKLKKEMCPCCRTEFNYLTKKVIMNID